ncbi:hypothetical protein QQS21_006432 [Conoideocrella luteorostrata]|uniref:AB hydrolase-1 domain-containing protein n=1 Tax=Conoideocrella luteorostrata TaxID=1105319 RepID=A0AAJ0FTG4_9HYPO|nr:hypothetical protein QQS21_006432 [Conoideocrella luteorostrata]
MPVKPTILLIPGGWHTIAAYQALIDNFESRNYPVVAPALPSGADKTPANPAEEDIALFSATAQSLVDDGAEVIAVAHSYGGTIAAEAFSGKGLRQRREAGLPGGVQMIVFVAAFVLEEGKNLESNAPIDIVPWCEYKDDLKIIAPGVDAGPVFYPDLPKDQQQKWLSTLIKHPRQCSFHCPSKTAYSEIDVAFVYCKQDVAFPYFAQRAMVEVLKAKGVEFQEVTLDSGHFPMLSMPNVLSERILQLI